MEVIKRKILLENGISRKPDTSYGSITASTFNVNIFLTQTYDDVGVYTDVEISNQKPNYSILLEKLYSKGYEYPFMTGATATVILNGFTDHIRLDNSSVSDWFFTGDKITAKTSSRLNELKSYNNNAQYITGFNIGKKTYTDYQNNTINGVSKVTKQDTSGDTVYVFDANDDYNIGTTGQTGGLLYTQKTKEGQTTGETQSEYDAATNVTFNSEGWNDTNTSLSAITKEEYLMGIIHPPEVFSDVFINRGVTSAMDKHFKLSEIKGVEQLDKYGGGFYNIVKI